MLDTGTIERVVIEMNIRILGLLVSLIVVAVFAVQNSAQTVIRFLTYELNISQALMIIIVAVIGCVIGLMISMVKTYKQGKIVKNTVKDYNQAQDKMKALEEKIFELETLNETLNVDLEAARVFSKTQMEAAEKARELAKDATVVKQEKSMIEGSKSEEQHMASNDNREEEETPKISLKDRWDKFMSE